MKINLLFVIYSLFFISFGSLLIYALTKPSVQDYLKHLKLEFNKKINNGKSNSFKKRKFIDLSSSSESKLDLRIDYDSEFTQTINHESNLKYLLYQLDSEVN